MKKILSNQGVNHSVVTLFPANENHCPQSYSESRVTIQGIFVGLLTKQQSSNNKHMLLFCGPSEGDDLAAQIVADLCEADGWEVKFGGGGVPADEILAETNESKPDTLCMFSSAPSDAPHIRNIIDTIKSIGASPQTQIVVGGGLFNRVDGLAEEIGADLWANSPSELKEKVISEVGRRAPEDQRTVGRSISTKAA